MCDITLREFIFMVSPIFSDTWPPVFPLGDVVNKYVIKLFIVVLSLSYYTPPGAVFCGGWPKMVALTGV